VNVKESKWKLKKSFFLPSLLYFIFFIATSETSNNSLQFCKALSFPEPFYLHFLFSLFIALCVQFIFIFPLSASCSHPISPSSKSLFSPTFFPHVFLIFYISPPFSRHKPSALRSPAPAHLLNLNPTQFAYFLYNFIRSQSFFSSPRLHLNNTNLFYICQLCDDLTFMNIIEYVPTFDSCCQRG